MLRTFFTSSYYGEYKKVYTIFSVIASLPKADEAICLVLASHPELTEGSLCF
jgi:hypothetical protein